MTNERSAPMRRVHELKTDHLVFEQMWSGTKTAEIRKNDRDYTMGDILILKEWHTGLEKFTGRELVRIVTHILFDDDGPGYGLMPDVVMLSLGKVQ